MSGDHFPLPFQAFWQHYLDSLTARSTIAGRLVICIRVELGFGSLFVRHQCPYGGDVMEAKQWNVSINGLVHKITVRWEQW
jgi:hypothetical protein